MEINISNLKKIYGDQVVLNNLELDIKGVHSLVIIGPSLSRIRNSRRREHHHKQQNPVI